MTTIIDVAERAGVSAMTVSRVINGGNKVSETTRKKVEKAISDLDYHPNLIAKGLVTGNSQIFAYVIPDISDPYFGAVMKSAQHASLDSDYSVVFFSADNGRALDNVLKTIVRRNYDGVVIHDEDPTDEQLKMLSEAGVSCVLIDNEREILSENISTIDIDHYLAASRIGEIFAEQGYKRAACVHGSTQPVSADSGEAPRRQMQRRIWKERFEGFRSVIERYPDIELIDIELNLKPEDDISSLGEMVGKKLSEHMDMPLAVFCAEDTLALAVKGYMQENLVSMPDNVAIFGTDGLDMATSIYPRISTAISPRKKIGELAAKELISTARDKHSHEHIRINVTDFFCGDTTYSF